MDSPPSLSASLEDYLEAIFHIVSVRKVARPRDIARRMKVGNSSVTGALRALSQKGMIEYAPYDLVTLTSEGERVGKDIARRHTSLRDFLENVLGVDRDVSERDACRMEHALSATVSQRLTEFVRFTERCPRWCNAWIEPPRECVDELPEPAACEACIQSCRDELRARRGREDTTKNHPSTPPRGGA